MTVFKFILTSSLFCLLLDSKASASECRSLSQETEVFCDESQTSLASLAVGSESVEELVYASKMNQIEVQAVLARCQPSVAACLEVCRSEIERLKTRIQADPSASHELTQRQQDHELCVVKQATVAKLQITQTSSTEFAEAAVLQQAMRAAHGESTSKERSPASVRSGWRGTAVPSFENDQIAPVSARGGSSLPDVTVTIGCDQVDASKTVVRSLGRTALLSQYDAVVKKLKNLGCNSNFKKL